MTSEIKQSNIRNFCIIAHIDHGKSTLADRMLELTHTVEMRNMKAQLLDQMDLERERGITIKLAPVRMEYSGHVLNLIDTPGHVDFSYEVSRSLAAVEGAILLVDASQGIEAQTLSTLYSAIEHDLVIIPVLNKIDLPAARPDEVKQEIIKLLGCDESEIILASGKTGEGVEDILNAVVDRIPAPSGDPNGELKALIFDSIYDPFRGVVAYLRIVDGCLKNNDEILLMQTKSKNKAEQVGYFKPKYFAHSPLLTGEIGYLVTGFRSVSEASVGDTITLAQKPALSPLSGYQKIKPFVFASIYATEGDKYPELKDAIEKLKMNDASLSFEPEQSDVLGHGFRCGFLGLLHMDIVRERLEREFDLDLVITSPTVEYKITKNNGETELIEKATDLPDAGTYREIFEPWCKVEIITPKEFIGAIMDISQKKRGIYQNTEYFEDGRAILHYDIPLAELIIDFYDQLKGSSRGYASMNYEISDFRLSKLSRIDILIAEDKVDALSFITFTPNAVGTARKIVEKLKILIPRQNFEVKIQAAIGGDIIASERISAFRKDVTAKLYGGDVTRKNKLLEKQKKGKKKMKQIGRINMPSDVFIKVLRNE